jgi:hypothetical protein
VEGVLWYPKKHQLNNFVKTRQRDLNSQHCYYLDELTHIRRAQLNLVAAIFSGGL